MSYKICHDTSIEMTEWLSEVFSAPPSSQRVAQMISLPEQEALRRQGEQLNASATVEALCNVLAQGDAENLTLHLQRRYTALFEGIFRHKAVLPYESAWRDSSAQTIIGMNATLHTLGLRVTAGCCEPPDHLAIELAALAMALRDEQSVVAADLTHRLQNWVPAFSAALLQQDTSGFYAAAGQLLLALIREMSAALTIGIPAEIHASGQYAGETL